MQELLGTQGAEGRAGRPPKACAWPASSVLLSAPCLSFCEMGTYSVGLLRMINEATHVPLPGIHWLLLPLSDAPRPRLISAPPDAIPPGRGCGTHHTVTLTVNKPSDRNPRVSAQGAQASVQTP